MCTPVIPFPPIADAPIVNVPEDRATDIGMQQKFAIDLARGSRDILADRQTDRQTDIIITILSFTNFSTAGEVNVRKV